MSKTAAAALPMKRSRSPQTVISRFVARRTMRGAALWALVFGGFVASKAIGFVDTYHTEAARQQVVATFSNNIGIEILLGPIKRSASVGSVVTWNTLGAMVMIGAVWALLLATKTLRGEEDAGRWEVLLSGPTSARRATANAIAGLGLSLGVFFVVIAAAFLLIGQAHGLGFRASASLLFAFTVVAGIALFMMAGALASQILPTRARASGVAATVFGICFLMRAVGDITSAHWLLNITPFGWIEKVQPLADSRPVWLLPIAAVTVILGGLAVFFAGRRDLGEGVLADNDTAEPRTAMLNSPLPATIRLTRAVNLGWLSGIFATALLYGLMTKSAAKAFAESASAQHILNRLAHQAQTASVTAFLGIIFFLQMIFIMAYAASSMSAIRRDEADGYLDNFLVEPFGRLSWLAGRIFLALSVIILAGAATGIGVWAGTASQHLSVSTGTLLSATANALVPAIITVGVGVFTFAVRPRLTSLLAYGVLSWSFLISMVSSGINLNHWILDTSILNQVVFAPAANPAWGTNAIIAAIAAVLCVLGAFIFNRRDLAAE